MSDIQRVGVVGSGLMGSGIAEVSARAGLDVIVVEVNADAAEAAQGRIATSLARGVKSGKLTRGGPRRRAGAHPVHHGHRRVRRPAVRGRGGRRERADQDRRLHRARQGREGRGRHLRVQHLVDPDHEAGHGHRPARAGHRRALLQPGAGAEARRDRAVAADRRHHAGPCGGVRARHARQGGDPLAGPRRVRGQRAADPLPAVVDPDARVRLRVAPTTSTTAWCSAARTRWARCA